MSTDLKKMTRKSVAKTGAPASKSERWAWALLVVVLLIITAIRVRLLAIPLERDEGEFAYIGQLMLDGIPPYKLAYSMKFPGIYAVYALIMAVFGQTIVGVHLGLLLANLIAIILLFLLGKRLIDPLGGVVASASYGFSSLGRCVLGTSAHATHFVMPFLLGGILLMLKGVESGKARVFFWSGLLLGMGVLVKQHAGVFIPFAVLYLLWAQLRVRPIAWADTLRKEGLLLAGSAIPVALAFVLLYAFGVFKEFWYWSFVYAREYLSEVPLNDIWFTFSFQLRHASGGFVLLWLIGAIGLVLLFLDRRFEGKRACLGGFALFAFLAACPGFFFRQHYFVPFFSAIALLAGVAVSSSRRMLSGQRYNLSALPIVVLAAALLWGVLANGALWFRADPIEASRQLYGNNPFPEAIDIAEYLKAHTSRNEPIAVLGSEPEILFYAHRRSATGYIYTYGLMERQKYAHLMQEQMIGQIESARPKYVVFVATHTSWLGKAHSDTTILRWAKQYLGKYYKPVGILDFISPDCILFVRDDDAEGYMPASATYIIIFKRLH